ncbi:MAG: 4Fe-4S binding protein [Clostridia bacterium]|nr:4Fe-4S binding protein [Clostridia bacterium]
MDTVYHSVGLDKSKCLGCMNCIKRCPTQAIRVRRGKATIITERCIDCGECIRICPHHAKSAQSDPLSVINDYKYKIALPAPSLYGQFNNLTDVNYVLTALLQIGFDHVFEVARGAEIISDATRKILKQGNVRKPLISCACPAVTRLITISYPELIDNILELNTPMDESARLARLEAMERTGLKAEDIGVFFITPCPAKITAIKNPLCLERSEVNGAIAISEVYPLLVQKMDKLKDIETLSESGRIGVSWAKSGGEASASLCEKYIAADGIENVIKILEEIEDEKLNDIEFIELNACTGGCVGGCLTVANTFVAKTRLNTLRKYRPVSCNHIEGDEVPKELNWEYPLEPMSVLKLADNVTDSMKLMNQVSQMVKNFPGLDCGTCGAPTCRALAEDIVRGYASIDHCIFRLKDEIQSSTDNDVDNLLPVPFRGIDEEKLKWT